MRVCNLNRAVARENISKILCDQVQETRPFTFFVSQRCQNLFEAIFFSVYERDLTQRKSASGCFTVRF